MGLPGRRHTSSQVGRRRAHDALKKIALAVCSACQAPRRPHMACPSCGAYTTKSASKNSKA